MKNCHLTIDSLVLLIAKTIMAFCVYVLFIFTVPAYDAIQEVGGISQIFTTKEHIVIGDASLVVEIVDNSVDRVKGLSGREGLETGQGMFFIFEKPGYHSIWMKEMNFPIDIIWLNNVKQVVSIEEDVSPDTYPKSFKPAKESLYVLETESGFVKENGIKVGDQLTNF